MLASDADDAGMTPDPSLKVRLGLAVRRRRERLGLTQEEFADSIGVQTAYYGQLERGRQNVTLWNLQRVAAGLGVSVSALLRVAETLDLSVAARTLHKPPRVGRPRGKSAGN